MIHAGKESTSLSSNEPSPRSATLTRKRWGEGTDTRVRARTHTQTQAPHFCALAELGQLQTSRKKRERPCFPREASPRLALRDYGRIFKAASSYAIG
ncbi:hypothetical protein QQF64_023475 [Cirrhinus molitorella]|uniref:Uncharacterized protein n=1 Tax=Cirrhinus molitorella TaxID=172907 RepID=A0ABR3L8T6_9TELE